jgi:hypothetical protein
MSRVTELSWIPKEYLPARASKDVLNKIYTQWSATQIKASNWKTFSREELLNQLK